MHLYFTESYSGSRIWASSLALISHIPTPHILPLGVITAHASTGLTSTHGGLVDMSFPSFAFRDNRFAGLRVFMASTLQFSNRILQETCDSRIVR